MIIRSLDKPYRPTHPYCSRCGEWMPAENAALVVEWNSIEFDYCQGCKQEEERKTAKGASA